MATIHLPPGSERAYDYVIVGGGTAGCVLGARLAQYLPERRVIIVETGPSDVDIPSVQNLKKWEQVLGGDLDYDYGTKEQPHGNSHIRQSRAKALGVMEKGVERQVAMSEYRTASIRLSIDA